MPIFAILALSAALFTPAIAHHSFAMFDNTGLVTVTGVVREFQWTNPHSWVWIEVEDDAGEGEVWGLEGMSPNYLGRRGWTRETLKPGDVITATIFPLKDDLPGGMFLDAALEDGTTVVMFAAPPIANERK